MQLAFKMKEREKEGLRETKLVFVTIQDKTQEVRVDNGLGKEMHYQEDVWLLSSESESMEEKYSAAENSRIAEKSVLTPMKKKGEMT